MHRLLSHTLSFLLVIGAGCKGWAQSGTSTEPVVNRMVVVEAPKVYDDMYLRNLLTSLQNQLASIHAVDQTTLLSHIGVVQGADLRQSSVAVSASGPTAANSVAAAAPTPVAPTLALPAISSLGQSSLDTYNESLQLSSQIENTALLLNGALSDSLQVDGKPRTTVTIGFPITVNPPGEKDRDLQNAVAEVRVKVCSNSTAEPPTIVTLLPAEKTYNVAGLVDKSFLGSLSAVLGGFASVGGSYLWSHKTYYLVQQQETIALLRSRGDCGRGYLATNFAWQIHPVLGKKFIRPGNSVNFVQISVPQVGDTSLAAKLIGSASVSIVWRKGDGKGQYVSEELPDNKSAAHEGCFPIYYYNLQGVESLQVMDIGQGAVAVKAEGSFLPGTTVRLGNAFLNPDTITARHNTLTFTASAKDIVAAGQAYIVSRDNQELMLVYKPKTPERKLSIQSIDIQPYSGGEASGDSALVTIRYTPFFEKKSGVEDPKTNEPERSRQPARAAIDPWVVVIGDKVFGLSESPFLSDTGSEIKLAVPTSLLQSAKRIELRRLLWDSENFSDSRPIPFDSYPKNTPVIAKTVVLSNRDGLVLGLIGTSLDKLQLVYPSRTDCRACKGRALDSTLFEVSLPKLTSTTPNRPKTKNSRLHSRPKPNPPPSNDPTDGLKELIFCQTGSTKPPNQQPGGSGDNCDSNFPRLIVDISKLSDPQVPEFAIDKHGAVAVNSHQVTLTGNLLDQVVSIEHAKISLPFRLSSDPKPSLVVELPDWIARVPGGYPVLVTLADKSTSAYTLTIKKPGS